MTTARQILQDALTFSLNRLSPGESADADTLDVGLRALNSVVDEWNGVKSFLFQTIITSSAAPISASSGTLGVTWVGLAPGDEILGATYLLNGMDFPMAPLTMRQYHERVANKSETSEPEFWAHDGLSTVYFYPIPNSKTIKLRTKAAVSEFADVDTDYTMPAGFRSALSDCVAERLAFVMLGGVPPNIANGARAARNRIAAQVCAPEIIGQAPRRNSIIEGF
jgi:hypothetical protein